MSIDVKELSKYPFLESLKEYLEISDFNLEEILSKENEILNASIARIKSLNEKDYLFDFDPDLNIKSFVVSLFIVAHLGTAFIEKFAERESKRLSKIIKNEIENKNFSEVIKISKFLISKDIEIKQIKTKNSVIDLFYLKIIDYLKYAAYLGDYNWALAFHEIKEGYIFLTFKGLSRILEEAYRQWIIIKCNELRGIYLPMIEPLIEKISKELPPVKKVFHYEEKIEYKGIDPPCMRMLLNDLKSGKKLSHMGNFALATYLRVIGYSVEETLELFKNLPDFKENIARYQIEHIYGLRGGRKVYSVPSCITLRAANLCFPESPGCDNIKHPLQYIKKIKNVRKQNN